MAEVVGFEPTNAGVKDQCREPLGYTSISMLQIYHSQIDLSRVLEGEFFGNFLRENEN